MEGTNASNYVKVKLKRNLTAMGFIYSQLFVFHFSIMSRSIPNIDSYKESLNSLQLQFAVMVVYFNQSKFSDLFCHTISKIKGLMPPKFTHLIPSDSENSFSYTKSKTKIYVAFLPKILFRNIPVFAIFFNCFLNTYTYFAQGVVISQQFDSNQGLINPLKCKTIMFLLCSNPTRT